MWDGDQSFQALVNDVDEFLDYIAIVKTPEVDAVREQLERSLGAARQDLIGAARRASGLRVGPTERPVRRNLWAAIAAASLLGALIGAAAGRRRQRVR